MPVLRRSLLLLAGASYFIAWVLGLVVFSSSTQVHSTGGQVLGSYTGHSGAVTTQFILTEGVTALALTVVLWHLAAGIDGRLGAVVRLTGLTAVVISLGQCGIGVFLASRIVTQHDPVAAGAAFDALNRLDGAKMLLLAASAAATAAAIHQARTRLPSWLAPVSVATAATLAVSAAGYLTLDNTLAAAAYASLPLLIGFVTSTSACLSRLPDNTIGSTGAGDTDSAREKARHGDVHRGHAHAESRAPQS